MVPRDGSSPIIHRLRTVHVDPAAGGARLCEREELRARFEADFARRCVDCGGGGWRIDPGGFGVPCACRLQRHRNIRLSAAGIPPDYEHCSLDNYAPATDSQLRALRAATQFARQFFTSPDQIGRGLLLRGPVGCGKTHLAVAVLRHLLAAGYTGMFLNFVHLLERLRQGFESSGSPPVDPIRRLDHLQVVVIDELGGVARPTEFAFTKLYDIVNRCFGQKTAILFTTNFLDHPPAPLGSARRGLPEEGGIERVIGLGQTLSERVSERLRSRILEKCLDVIIDGPDHRLSRHRVIR